MKSLIKFKGPKTAYQILEHIHKNDPAAKPATIYRALDFLCSNHFAHRIESDNTYVACDGNESAHVAQFLICISCKQAIEFHSHKATTEISKKAKKEGFKISVWTVDDPKKAASLQKSKIDFITTDKL